MDIRSLLEKSAQHHDHLCPRQVLGVRIGLAGLRLLGLAEPPANKRLLVIVETDGCFVDGVTAATGCTVGHRTLRVQDYGKVAATFVEVPGGRAFRAAPALEIRDRALLFAPDEPRHYFAQLKAYQTMPDELMFHVERVQLRTPVTDLISRAGVRVNCDLCGEEIINERELLQDAVTLCLSCAHGGYYHTEREAVGAFGLQREALLSS